MQKFKFSEWSKLLATLKWRKKDTILFQVGGFKQIYINGGILNWEMKVNGDSPLFHMKMHQKIIFFKITL